MKLLSTYSPSKGSVGTASNSSKVAQELHKAALSELQAASEWGLWALCTALVRVLHTAPSKAAVQNNFQGNCMQPLQASYMQPFKGVGHSLSKAAAGSASKGAMHSPSKGPAYNPFCDTLKFTMKNTVGLNSCFLKSKRNNC